MYFLEYVLLPSTEGLDSCLVDTLWDQVRCEDMDKMSCALSETDLIICDDDNRICVGLYFNKEKGSAPKMTIAGYKSTCTPIIDMALYQDIPVYKYTALAKALIALVDLGEEIGPELYASVADQYARAYKEGKFIWMD